jgi:hypothetical protein
LVPFEEEEMKYVEAILLGSVVWMAAPALWAAAPSGQYTDLKNGTVKDNKTGLVWQQAVAIQDDWTNAKSDCAGLRLGGFSSGWRLPTKLELESLVDFGVASPGPTIDSKAFPLTPAEAFWTSTLWGGTSNYAWYVDFGSGSSRHYYTTTSYRVRCVH